MANIRETFVIPRLGVYISKITEFNKQNPKLSTDQLRTYMNNQANKMEHTLKWVAPSVSRGYSQCTFSVNTSADNYIYYRIELIEESNIFDSGESILRKNMDITTHIRDLNEKIEKLCNSGVQEFKKVYFHVNNQDTFKKYYGEDKFMSLARDVSVATLMGRYLPDDKYLVVEDIKNKSDKQITSYSSVQVEFILSSVENIIITNYFPHQSQ